MIPVYFDDDAAVADVCAALGSVGYCLRTDGAGRMVAEPIPASLRPDPPRSNVVTMPARIRKARS